MTELPNGWTEVDIVEVLGKNENGKPFQQGWSPQCENFPSHDGSWGVLKTTAIQHGEFWPHENKALPESLEPRPNVEVMVGDVLMTCAGPRNRCGVACLVEKTRPKLMMSGKMYRFRPNPEALHPKYLAYLIQRRETQLQIDRMKTGINDSGLNLTHDRFAQLRIPLAPILEQKRIVAKIEELFSELDSASESLKRARAQLKVYSQALLKAAFEGKLTSDWRIANGEKNLSKAIPTINPSDDDELFSIPQSWRYVRLEFLTDPERSITYGVIKLGEEVINGVPVLRSSDVRALRLDLDGVKRVSPDIAKEYRRTFLKGGEVLITVRGTLGGVAVVPPELKDWNISREVAMIAPTDAITATYLQYVLASPQLASWFKKRLRGVAYTGINIATLKEAPIYLCIPDEQQKVVEILEEKLSVVTATLAEVESGLAKINALRQSILKRAFSGNLVPHDASEEPTSVLLTRLRVQLPTQKIRRKTTA